MVAAYMDPSGLVHTRTDQGYSKGLLDLFKAGGRSYITASPAAAANRGYVKWVDGQLLPNNSNQKRPHSSPEATPYTIVKNKKQKKAKKKINAESSISDHHNTSDDENTSDLACMHKIITGKKTFTKKDFKK